MTYFCMCHNFSYIFLKFLQVHLVSEHIWCDDYLVRSFYLKNLQTNETRTVTQFHFLTWPDLGVPSSAKALLDFRRWEKERQCLLIPHKLWNVGFGSFLAEHVQFPHADTVSNTLRLFDWGSQKKQLSYQDGLSWLWNVIFLTRLAALEKLTWNVRTGGYKILQSFCFNGGPLTVYLSDSCWSCNACFASWQLHFQVILIYWMTSQNWSLALFLDMVFLPNTTIVGKGLSREQFFCWASIQFFFASQFIPIVGNMHLAYTITLCSKPFGQFVHLKSLENALAY